MLNTIAELPAYRYFAEKHLSEEERQAIIDCLAEHPKAGDVKRSSESTREAILGWVDSFEVADSTWPAFQAVFDLMVDHKLPVWDALILAVAAESLPPAPE